MLFDVQFNLKPSSCAVHLDALVVDLIVHFFGSYSGLTNTF